MWLMAFVNISLFIYFNSDSNLAFEKKKLFIEYYVFPILMSGLPLQYDFIWYFDRYANFKYLIDMSQL